MPTPSHKACLIVIDGWGIPSADSPKDGDAITNAKTPVMDELYKSPTGYTELEASSLAVGLPEGAAGGQRLGAVKHPDVVQAEEAALEQVVALGVLAVDPPGEIQQQLRQPPQTLRISWQQNRR